MPRLARLAVPDIARPIIQRGNDRSPCFYSDDDHRKYPRILGEQTRTCVVHRGNTRPWTAIPMIAGESTEPCFAPRWSQR